MKELNFVIIGAQKSSSTFLQTLINEHPEAFLPRDEISYFEAHTQDKNSIAYFDYLFADSSASKYGIKRPNYLGITGVEKKIYNHNSNTKLIAVLRNPIDRMVSAYFHYIRDGFIPVLDINVGIDLIINSNAFKKQYPRAEEILEFGFYAKHLNRYYTYFDKLSLKVFLHEDVISNPLDVAKRTYQFLDLSLDYIPKNIYSRPQSVVYNYKRLKVLRIFSLFTNKYSKDSRLILRKKSNFHRGLYYAYKKLDESLLDYFLPNSKPKLSDESFNRLADIYFQDVTNLSLILNRDLTHWLERQ